jgi:hypothetical protein
MADPGMRDARVLAEPDEIVAFVESETQARERYSSETR